MNKYEEMLPAEFAEEIKRIPVVFVPTGLLEWHGDHLPLGVDGLKAYGICEQISKRIGGGILMPPNYFGRPGFSSYIGTLTFSEACIDLLLMELFAELKKIGAKIIVLITGHYGPCQVDLIKRVSAYFMKANRDITVIAQPEYEGVEVNKESPQDHADKWETSMMMRLRPDLVHMERFDPVKTKQKKFYNYPPNRFYDEQEEWYWNSNLHESASSELGEKVIEMISIYVATKIQVALTRNSR
jgi:creatinine amidohydrolase